MRNLRKFSVFLLFIAVFGVLLYSLFPAALGDMAENLRSGGGTRTFIQAVQGADGVAYALEAERGGGYTLYGTSAEGRVSTRPLSEGLPQDFSVEQIYVAKNGCILLGLYERAGMELTRYALYAALPEQPFQLLLEAPLSGITADQRRASAGLLYAAADGELVELAVLQEGEYARYPFDPAQGQGLVAAGALTGGRGPAGPGCQRGGPGAGRAGRVPGGAARRQRGVAGPHRHGGALALLLRAADVAIGIPRRRAYHLSAGLYRTPWQSGLVLALLVAGVLFLSYGFYYLVCEYQKLYFPLVVKNLMWLGLAGYVAVKRSAAVCRGPQVSCRGGGEHPGWAGGPGRPGDCGGRGLDRRPPRPWPRRIEAYGDCTFLRLGPGADGT